MKPRTVRKASSNASHGLRSRHCAASVADMAAGDPQGRGAAGVGGQAAGGQDRVEERQSQRRQDRRGPQVALDPLEDRAEPDQLARRVQVEQLVRAASRRRRCPGTARGASPASRRPDVGRGPGQVVGVERGLALLGAAALIATDRAAVVPGDRPRGRRPARRPGPRATTRPRPRRASGRTSRSGSRTGRRSRPSGSNRLAARPPCPGTRHRDGGRPAAGAPPRRASG